MWFSNDSIEAQAHANLAGEGHQAHLSHELIAAAASYEAAKAYEHHVRKHGKPVSHGEAVAILAGVTGAFVERVAETKGMDAFDRERAKRLAHERAEGALARSGEY